MSKKSYATHCLLRIEYIGEKLFSRTESDFLPKRNKLVHHSMADALHTFRFIKRKKKCFTNMRMIYLVLTKSSTISDKSSIFFRAKVKVDQ